MAIIFNKVIQQSAISSGLIASMTNNFFYSGGGSAYSAKGTVAITIFSGTQPTSANIISNWSTFNNSFLCHWQNIQLVQMWLSTTTSPNTPTNLLQLYELSSGASAENSGISTWAIVWPTNPTQSAVSGSSIPSTKFLIVPVSNSQEDGVVILYDTNIVSGNNYYIADFSMSAFGGSN